MFGYRGASEGLKLTLFRTKKSPKIPTLSKTTTSILGPCLGQMTKYTLLFYTILIQVFSRPANV